MCGDWSEFTPIEDEDEELDTSLDPELDETGTPAEPAPTA